MLKFWSTALFFSCAFYLFLREGFASRLPRALGETIFTIKGFDNCADVGKGQIKWVNTKLKFGKNARVTFSGTLHLEFPLTSDGETTVKMTTYLWQNGGYKMMFRTETKSIWALVKRLSPPNYQGLLECFNTTSEYLGVGDHECTNWRPVPIKKALPITVKTKAYFTLDYFRSNQKLGCLKLLIDAN